jgi:hypothetical protein
MKKTISLFVFVLLLASCTNSAEKTSQTADADKKDSLNFSKTDSLQADTLSKKTETAKQATVNKQLNDLARVIAGMPVDSTSEYYRFTKSATWKRFAKNMDSSFAKVDRERFSKMRQWSETELTAANDGRDLYYPFSGPDFVHAYQFFNKAPHLYMFGLEGVGNMPDLSKKTDADMVNYYASIQNYLRDVMNKSFFITRQMKNNWFQVKGMTPIICVFMVRTGNKIAAITPMRVDTAGILTENLGKKVSDVVKIDFFDATTGAAKTVYYYSGDLSDGAITKNSPIEKYLNNIPDNAAGFLKSASYLLHYAYFSKMTQSLMDRCSIILQDDTGIPYKIIAANKKDWEVTFYGIYATPIFPSSEQPNLRKAFKDSTNTIKPLPFGIGYHWMNRKDNLLLLTKKKSV